jgi:hypothetical protein
MCWLGFDEQLINVQPLMFWERAQVYSKLYHGQQVERFLGWHGVGVG